jgi:hypothetical protein
MRWGWISRSQQQACLGEAEGGGVEESRHPTVKERRRCRRISGSEDGEQAIEKGRAGKRVKKIAARGSGLVIRFSSCAERGTSGARVFRVTLGARWRKKSISTRAGKRCRFSFLICILNVPHVRSFFFSIVNKYLTILCIFSVDYNPDYLLKFLTLIN